MTANSTDTAKQSVERLRRLDCCAVSDACDKLGLRDRVVTGVPRQSGSTRVAGCVTTVKLGLEEVPASPPRHLGTTAVELSGPDNVIVVEQRTGRDAGSWGGILTLGAKVRGVAGVLADGPVRDIDEAVAYDFPIFTRSRTALTARGRVFEMGTNVPIVFEGVPVNAGDFVIADASGIAFIPADRIDDVLDAAEAIATREAAMAKAILDGKPITQVMGGNYENMLKG